MTFTELYDVLISPYWDKICANDDSSGQSSTNVFFKLDNITYLFVDHTPLQYHIEAERPELKIIEVYIEKRKDMAIFLSKYDSLYENIGKDEPFQFKSFIIPDFILDMDEEDYELWRKLQ